MNIKWENFFKTHIICGAFFQVKILDVADWFDLPFRDINLFTILAIGSF